MSFKNNQHCKGTNPSNLIKFTITENIEKLGIKEFVLKDKDFLITWSDERQICLGFHSKNASLEQTVKKIKKRLRQEVKNNVDDKTFESAIQNIEDQLVKRREEVFNLNLPTKTTEDSSYDEFKTKFLEDVSNLREDFEKCGEPFKEWQFQVYKKREILRLTTIKYYPEAWPTLEFCLAVKTILNIDRNHLPFIGLILARPSSLKTTITKLFLKYPNAFYSDSFSPNSFASHISGLTEEELRKNVDMLPKIKNKLFVTPELASIFTAKDDDLRKLLGLITRLADGDGLQSDSGVHGHRAYSATMFTWIGAIVEISPKVWEMFSLLGFKIYCFRPNIKEKSIEDLTDIIKDDDSNLNNEKIEEALFEYLKVFDACPRSENSNVDENGIVKIKWDSTLLLLGNEYQNSEQINSIRFIAQIAKLLAPVRGTVNVYSSRSRKYIRNRNDRDSDDSNSNDEDVSYQTEQLDYETDSPTIEDPSRAAIVLRNLGLANAISQGRNYLTREDVKLIIDVAFSTTRAHRSKLLDLLLKNGGDITTSKIVNELEMSEPKARMTMREFEALGIGKISSISGHANSELRIKLNNEFNWFLTEEFRKLRNPVINIEPDFSREVISCYNNKMYQMMIIKNLNNKSSMTCDDRHTLKQNLPQGRDIKNNNILQYDSKTKGQLTTHINSQEPLDSAEKAIISKSNYNHNNKSNDIHNIHRKIEYPKQEEITSKNEIDNSNDNKDDGSYKISIKENNITDKLQKNNPSLGPEPFQHVTVSHENCHTDLVKNVVDEILHIIKNENGTISLGYALQLACQRSNIVQDYLRNEKLTQRDSRKVRNMLVEIIRHRNIQIVKRKPELVVKWVENEKEMIINN